ncbi:MAG: ATP-binding cassette domain-containing protein [Rhodospirillaceae bacterium]
MAETNAIEVSHVEYVFDRGENEKKVLFDNNLSIRRGEIVIMTGPSGSGKTTLLTLIGTLRSVQTGDISFLGRGLKGRTTAEINALRREIGFIFQHHNLFSALSAMDTLRVSMQLRAEQVGRREAEAEAAELLERLGLGDRMHYKPANLSGGQKQRVAIARAMINRPNLILADEPTAALDQESGHTVISLFQELAHRHGATVLIVTHDNRILDAADRIVNMLDGHIHSNVLIKEHVRLCEIMAKIPVFKHTRAAVLDSLVHYLHREVREAGETVIRQGEEGDRFYILDKGTARVLIDKGAGPEEVARLADGSGFGELALLEDSTRHASIVTETPCELYWLSKEEFLKSVSDAPSLAEELQSMYM